jgi:hypothetical protein
MDIHGIQIGRSKEENSDKSPDVFIEVDPGAWLEVASAKVTHYNWR